MRRLPVLLLAAVAMAMPAKAQRPAPSAPPDALILGGELSNSAATSQADIDEVMPRMRAAGLNTVLVPVYWELMEPVEHQFDMSLIDRTIAKARANDLKVILLWFGAWKNSMSCYAPAWLKQDTRRFPRAMTRSGKPLEIASAFAEELLQADSKAFCQLMRHLKATDSRERTVTMVQVENEIGMLEDARDHSPLAEKAYRQRVPQELLKALGIKRNGTWSEVLGTSLEADEKFQAWHYACYVQRLAAAAHQIYDIPFFVNAAMNSRGRKPGEYPSAGPLAHLTAIWKCAAPDIAMLSPDIYDTGFKSWAAQYDLPGNRLFIPESRCCLNSGVRALYAVGEHRALGFSPFAIDQAAPAEVEQLSRAYGLLRQLKAVKGQSWGLLFDKTDKERQIADGNLLITCRHYFTLPWDARATDGSEWREGGGIIMRLSDREYLVAGSGIVVEFRTVSEHRQAVSQALGEDGFAEKGADSGGSQPLRPFEGKRCGLLSVDEVAVSPTGEMTCLRRDNGDQTHQGRHVRISVDDYRILRVKLYVY